MLGEDGDSRVVVQRGHILACVTTVLYTMCCGAELIGSDTHSGAITSTDGSMLLRSRTDACYYTRMGHPVHGEESMSSHVADVGHTELPDRTVWQSCDKTYKTLRAFHSFAYC